MRMMRIPSLVLLLALALCGCRTVVPPLTTDHGRQAFLRGDYARSAEVLEQAKTEQREFTQQSYASLYGSLMKRTFVRGAYQPMYRDRFLAHFYQGLNYLALRQPAQAAAEMGEMERMMDELDAECATPPEDTDVDSLQEELDDDSGKLKSYYDQTQEEFANFADLRNDPDLARFYNPAALLLAAFLEGLDGNDEEFAYCCAKVAESGQAPLTLQRMREAVGANALAGKALVVIAVGHGPRLTERVIGSEKAKAKLMSFTTLLSEEECLQRQNGDFDPRRPIPMQVGEWRLSAEVAANLYTSLAAEFARRERRLYWEQLVRVLVRDLIAEGIIIAGGRRAKRSLARMLITGGASVGWFFARQKLMTPDLRCLQDAPWDYQVALVDIPPDRQVNFQTPIPCDVAIPPCENAVVYLNCPDANTTTAPVVFVVK